MAGDRPSQRRGIPADALGEGGDALTVQQIA